MTTGAARKKERKPYSATEVSVESSEQSCVNGMSCAHSWRFSIVVALLILLGVIWGSTFLVISVTLKNGMSPAWLAAARVVFAALLMSVVWTARGLRLFGKRVSRRVWFETFVVAILSSTIPFTLLAWGQQSVTTSFTGVTMASSLIIILPLSHLLIPGERMTLRAVAGVVIGLFGVILLIGGDAFASTGADNELLSRLAVLATASSYAVSSVLMRRLPPVDPIGLAALLMIMGAATIIPAAIFLEGAPPSVSMTPSILGALALLGLLHTAAANFLRVHIVRSAGPTFMGLVNYIVPVISALLGTLVLREALPPSLMIALVFILAGMAISEWPSLRRLVGKSRR